MKPLRIVNPIPRETYLKDIGTLDEAARIAGVKPGTIRVWESRGKLTRLRIAGGEPLYHLPTVNLIAADGRKNTPSDPAKNSRRPHRHRPKAA
jgi:hypothetical protein